MLADAIKHEDAVRVSATPVPDISVVIPCRNEAANVEAITAAVAAELQAAQVSYEIILIDNASQDETVELAKRLCAGDPRIKLIVNNQNYGQLRSPTYGIYQASGAAVIGMCADFQDPPAMIGRFVERWRAGVEIVLGVRQSERGSLVLPVLRSLGYGFLRRFGDYPVIPGATGFGLYDRAVVDCLAQWREPEPFFRGMLVESGYRLETIAYVRPPRAAGRSNNNFGTLLSFAISGVTSCSKKLLRLPLYFAAACMGLGFCGVAASIVLAAIEKLRFDLLWASCGVFLFGWVFFFLGLIGDQVRVISERTRQTPLVIEKERINFPPIAY